MKKFILAISFVFAFAVVATAQTKKTAADTPPPATEEAQPGDKGYTAPATAAPASVNVNEKNNTANKATTKKSCSKAKACKKGKSCCKKGAEATAAKKEVKACCKNKEKACSGEKKEEAKEDEVKKEEASTEATTPVPAVKASEQ